MQMTKRPNGEKRANGTLIAEAPALRRENMVLRSASDDLIHACDKILDKVLVGEAEIKTNHLVAFQCAVNRLKAIRGRTSNRINTLRLRVAITQRIGDNQAMGRSVDLDIPGATWEDDGLDSKIRNIMAEKHPGWLVKGYALVKGES